MPIVLFRVDERLIHGQVVVGWGRTLRPDRIAVVDDELAGSDWEQELYVLGLPPGMAAEFDAVDVARDRLPQWRAGKDRVLVLTRDVATMARLGARGGLRGDEVNLGGIHFAPGRTAVLPYLYFSEEDRRAVERLVQEGVTVTARDLPGARSVPSEELLDRDGSAPP